MTTAMTTRITTIIRTAIAKAIVITIAIVIIIIMWKWLDEFDMASDILCFVFLQQVCLLGPVKILRHVFTQRAAGILSLLGFYPFIAI